MQKRLKKEKEQKKQFLTVVLFFIDIVWKYHAVTVKTSKGCYYRDAALQPQGKLCFKSLIVPLFFFFDYYFLSLI